MAFDVHDLHSSVIICAYTEERWDDLVSAVDSIYNQTVLPQELIVVVDHNPALFERARATFPRVTLVENIEPRGLSGARNSGIRVASGEIIVFLDDDAIAAHDWLQQLLTSYSEPAVVGVGGSIHPLWSEQRPAWFPEEFNWIVGCTYRGMPVAPAGVRNLIGCNMSFRREVFASVGYFRNGIGRVGTLPVGCEETELCIRIRQCWPEKVILYQPSARVQHHVPASRGRWSYFQARCYAEGLSKALVSRLVGSSDGLASERTYTLQTLPAGVVRGFGDALLKRDISGLGRAGAIVGGLGITTAGYVWGSLAHLRNRQRGIREQITVDPSSDAFRGERTPNTP